MAHADMVSPGALTSARFDGEYRFLEEYLGGEFDVAIRNN
jgi:hypothetical protein